MRAWVMATAALIAVPAWAQQPPATSSSGAASDSGIAEIVVTARRRAENQQSVPIAVSAYNSATLEALSVRTVGDVADVTPNLSRTSGPTGGNDAFFFIRGIGQLDSNPANDPGVGVYVDGVYLGRLQGASLDAFDLARVEVLRGPQGTLFGRNTIGGAISLTSLDPASTFGARARATIGDRNRYDGFVSVDAPLGDTLGVRLSVGTRNQDGWGRNVYTGRTFGDVHNISARAKAVWKPDDRLKVTLSADGLHGRGGTAQTIQAAFNPAAGPAIPGTTPLGVPFPRDLLADTSPDPFRNFNSVAPKYRTDNWGASATIEYDLGPIAVKTILAYRKTKQDANNDFDGTGYRLYDNQFRTDSDQYSAELQLLGKLWDGRIDYVAGVYAYEEGIGHTNAICLGTNLGAPFGPFGPTRNTGGCIENNQRFKLGIDNIAGFGQANVNITDKLAVTLGARYTYEKKRQSFDFYFDNSAGVFSFFGLPPLAYIPTLSPNNPNVGVPTRYQKDFDEFTPKVGVQWKAQKTFLLYASYSQGFKSGGFNGRPNADSAGGFLPIQPFAPEDLYAYEIGFKSDLFDRHLRLNGALYYSIYKGIQLLVLDPASGFFNNENAGRNIIKGFELESTLKPTRASSLYLNLGYDDNHYTFINPLTLIPKSARLPVTPELTLGAGGDYRFDLGRLGSLTPRADYSYRSSVYYGANNGQYEFQRGYGLLNVRVTWADPSDRFTIAAYGLNALDQRYISNAQDVTGSLGIAFAQVGAPAEFGLEAGVKF